MAHVEEERDQAVLRPESDAVNQETIVEAEVGASVADEEVSVDETEVNPLQDLEAEKVALEDQLLRLQAELQNMRRIHQRERQDAAKYRSQSLATALLDVADNLERALATSADSEDAKSLHKGVEMVYQQFMQAFDKEGIQVLNPIDQPFDPNFHQAVSVMPATDNQASDTVLTVLQKGYLLEDRVLRPAMVIVAQ